MKQPLPKQSPLKKFNPIIDEDGLLGGSLAPANVTTEEKHPLIIPGTHHNATLLVTSYHEEVAHRGWPIRAAWLWIIGSKRLVSSVIFQCVISCTLRRNLQFQKILFVPVKNWKSTKVMLLCTTIFRKKATHGNSTPHIPNTWTVRGKGSLESRMQWFFSLHILNSHMKYWVL